jgi:zinc/manganese transport system permease protein
MFEYDFMRTAFLAGGVVAVVAGAVGFFLVLRNLTFAGHALAHVGFAGATGSVLIGIGALWGLLGFTLLAAVAMGLLGDRLRTRDVAVGIVLSLALGLGVLFLYLYTTNASEATAILFGNLLGVSFSTLRGLLGLSLVSILALAAISRPLLFATLGPELAEAKGVSLRLVSVLFLAIVGIAVAEAAQVVGVLLVFALMVGPAAAALRLASRLYLGIALAVGLALIETWGGIALAYMTDWPTSFWIVVLSCLGYFLSLAKRPGGAGASA